MAEPTVELTLGAIEVGSNFSSVLYGLSLLQTYIYFTNCSGDRRAFKITVALVAFFESINLALVWAYLYDISVTRFGDLYLGVPWQLNVVLASHGIVGTIVQVFFAFRLYIVSQNIWVAIPAWSLSFLRFVFLTVISVLFSLVDVATFRANYNWVIYLSLSLSTIVDIYNTIGLCWRLWHRKSDHKGTDNIVNRVILWSMETGLATSTFSVAIITFWAVSPNTDLWVTVLFIYTRLYSNSLLVSLNARHSARRGRSQGAVKHSASHSNSLGHTRSTAVELDDVESPPANRRVHVEVPDVLVIGREASKRGYGFEQWE